MIKAIKRDRYLLLLTTPVIVYFLVFHYAPMYGLLIAFKDYKFSAGILGSPWVGFKWFDEFLNSYYFGRLMRNTAMLSLYLIVWGFPIPILFAILLNELRDGPYKRVIQTVSYMPHFLSVVVVVGMLVTFLTPRFGLVSQLVTMAGNRYTNPIGDPAYFRTLYVATDIWQGFGWDSIIYLSAITAIDPGLYEAARVDGCGRLRQMWHITLAGIRPTIVILLILRLGNIMSVGFEKIILMYSPAIYDTADVISTYVYRRGILKTEYSFGAAVGLFNSIINFALLVIVNRASKAIGEAGLW